MNIYHQLKKSKVILDRRKIMLKLVKGKKVLDIGCVDHKAELESGDKWLHKNIKKYAKSVIGLDYSEKEVKRLQEKGYNIVVGNAENFDLNEKFEVITAGEIIEHLSNQGLFLDSVRKHLKKDGLFVFTTPNNTNLFNFIEVLIFGQTIINPEHVLWHSFATVKQLVERHGFKIAGHFYIMSDDSHFYSKWWKRILIKLRWYFQRFVVFFRKDFSSNHLFILKLKD